MDHCRYCLGTALRAYEQKVQCMTCFCIGTSIKIRIDRPDCPICFEDVFIGGKLVIEPESAAAKGLARGECPPALTICPQCSIFVCMSCSEQMPSLKCPQCTHVGMVVGHATNTSSLDHVGDDLRVLLADFIMLYYKKGQKQNGHMLWEKTLEYYKWLSVVKYVPDDPNNLYSPCKLIDKMWHFHILYTKNYRATCEILCGQYIDHRPVFEADWERAKRLEASIVAIRQREPFTAYTAKIWDIPRQSPAFNLAAIGKVHIKTLTGRFMEIGYHPKYTIADLLIKLDLCLTGTRVIYDGHRLDIDKTCEEYGIKAGVTLHSVQNLAGC